MLDIVSCNTSGWSNCNIHFEQLKHMKYADERLYKTLETCTYNYYNMSRLLLKHGVAQGV
jgi:hypothetical protein